ncbi:glycosyltransferase [Paracoccus luteus]|uniref:glycosyltransferase n=1 Tax=Paracoccus luteus TaxID=2508543 RepID=UPI00106F2D05|nr:glycosyltransferase [Paracoccus luteus]
MIPLSIIIPAHDEVDWIGPCLDSLLAQDHAGAVQVVVVANGCRDDTAARARQSGPAFAARGWALRVEDLAQGGKPGALNHGDACATHEGRVYLDADITLGPGLLAGLAAALDRPQAAYASGRLVVAPARTAATRAYARFWSRLPFVAQGVPGAGLFAVNAAGRARWGGFPGIISDDTFVRLHFSPDERILVDAPYLWPAVEGLGRLVVVRRRQNAGVDEIARLYPALAGGTTEARPSRATILGLALSDPAGFATYAAVALAVRLKRQGSGWTRGR